MPAQADDPIRDAREAIIRAIAELKAAGIPVPTSLHLACHALAYAASATRIPDNAGTIP